MRIALLCATARGLAVARRLRELRPRDELALVSFREEPWEPPFLDDLRGFAGQAGALFFEGKDLASPALRPLWSDGAPDLMLAVNWRHLLPAAVYERPRRGTFVFHDSLLPAYRGFSPTLWAILNGERRTGVTLFKMGERYDEGDIADQEAVEIGPEDTIGDVLPRVTAAYLRVLERALEPLLCGTLALRPQDASAATYTCKWTPEDLRIDWGWPAPRVHDLIRACGDPYPGAYTLLDGARLKVWAARRPGDGRRFVSRLPGRVLEAIPGVGSWVLAGDGPLLLTQVQLEGGERVCAADVLKRLSQRVGS